MKAFVAALDSMGKDRFSIGKIAPSKPLVDQYFNDSTGEAIEARSTPLARGTRALTSRLWKRQRFSLTDLDRESNRKRRTRLIP
jgi:hypothetical protein